MVVRCQVGGKVNFTAKRALFLPEMAQFDYLVNLPENVASLGLLNVYRTDLGEPG